jgi:endo-alpha-N-acetylgalactosaminidase
VKHVSRICLICCLLSATVHRLPAPIVETEEKPTPAPKPEQSAKPKTKRAIKGRTSESPERSTRSQQISPALTNAAASDGKPFTIPQSEIRASATSQHPGREARNAVDGNDKTTWHTPWGLLGPKISLPQSIILNLGRTYNVIGLRYLPRQDSNLHGNILRYEIYVSTDGNNFTQIAAGNWSDDHTEKSATFAPTRASYLRLEAVATHDGHASAAELNVTAAQ